MSRIAGVHIVDENTRYCHYSDECWMQLAQSIIADAAESYANQFPKFCRDQKEFETLDRKSYAPIRKGILTKLFNCPIRSILDTTAVTDAFNRKWAQEVKDYNQVYNLK